jgi:hypothetical protein
VHWQKVNLCTPDIQKNHPVVLGSRGSGVMVLGSGRELSVDESTENKGWDNDMECGVRPRKRTNIRGKWSDDGVGYSGETILNSR